MFTSLAFVIWVGFFDENSFINQVRDTIEISSLERDKKFYVDEIRRSKDDLNVLATDQDRLERFAREKYLMKKEDEDIFVLTTK